jgi:Fe-S-cluster formation regulator IscX/YfhJ
MKTLVRCNDRMVFEIDPVTKEARSCSCYDAYCFSDPRTDVTYIEYFEWLNHCSELNDDPRRHHRP